MATEIKTWEIRDGVLVPISSRLADAGRTESLDLETWIASDPGIVRPGLRILGRQVTTRSGPLDLLAIDRSGDLVIIELKRDKLPREVLAQAIDYAADVATWPLEKVGEICAKYTGETLVSCACGCGGLFPRYDSFKRERGSVAIAGKTFGHLISAPPHGWPLPNAWLGASAENQAAADERIPHLLHCPAAVRFLSCEPLLGPVDLNKYLLPLHLEGHCATMGVHWVIAGGESGPGARPCDVAWLRSLRDKCAAAGVPFILKQLGARPFTQTSEVFGRGRSEDRKAGGWWHHLCDPKGGDPSEWPKDLRVREYPEVARG